MGPGESQGRSSQVSGGPLAFPWTPLALLGCPWPPKEQRLNLQEEPGKAKRSKEEPGVARRSQEELGASEHPDPPVFLQLSLRPK